ncbi:hypothetical protein EVAR_9127_1 [Eumeta japonica]|uniref:Uncharacterized protein n=1 Tax=Eumeta variegata TaxID=151549 RepID=A0A4C1TWM7_EUMVA|nr:hypothetical protein EVAR_9127_1 [Eumeta japonica]
MNAQREGPPTLELPSARRNVYTIKKERHGGLRIYDYPCTVAQSRQEAVNKQLSSIRLQSAGTALYVGKQFRDANEPVAANENVVEATPKYVFSKDIEHRYLRGRRKRNDKCLICAKQRASSLRTAAPVTWLTAEFALSEGDFSSNSHQPTPERPDDRCRDCFIGIDDIEDSARRRDLAFSLPALDPLSGEDVFVPHRCTGLQTQAAGRGFVRMEIEKKCACIRIHA